MILNQRSYRKIERKEKREYLQNLTEQEALRHLEELAEFAWPFISKKARPQPVALALLLKKG